MMQHTPMLVCQPCLGVEFHCRAGILGLFTDREGRPFGHPLMVDTLMRRACEGLWAQKEEGHG
jgi:hypothetical protein